MREDNSQLAVHHKIRLIAILAFAFLTLLQSPANHVVNAQQNSACDKLGTEWLVKESGWAGTWKRVGQSSQFKGEWRRGGRVEFTSDVSLSISGDRVSGRRHDPDGNRDFAYEGTISPNGLSASGVRRQLYSDGTKGSEYTWEAVISCSGTLDPTEDRIKAQAQSCPSELVAGALPSEPCTICISDWRLNTADPVIVEFPLNIDSYGSQSNGLQVFGGGSTGDNGDPITRMQAQVYDWSGHICPQGRPPGTVHSNRTFPWGIFVRAREQAAAGPKILLIRVRQKGAGEVEIRVPINVKAKPKNPGKNTLVPLKLFYSDARGDNYTTATAAGEQAARSNGYRFIRIEGYVFSTQQAGTVPLKLYYSDARQDNYTTATQSGEQAAKSSGYRYVHVEGYVYPTQQPGTVPLKNYWGSRPGDNFTMATADGERDAKSSGYQFALVEGYLSPVAGTSMFPKDEYTLDKPSRFNGKWDEGQDWGIINLTQTGDAVKGTFSCCGGGTMQGTATGTVLKFSWNRSNGVSGEGKMILNSNRTVGIAWCDGKGCDPTYGKSVVFRPGL